jgi:hypothetical protein
VFLERWRTLSGELQAASAASGYLARFRAAAAAARREARVRASEGATGADVRR